MTEPLEDDLSLGERYSLCWTDRQPMIRTSAAFLASHAHSRPAEQLEVLLLDQYLPLEERSPTTGRGVPGRLPRADRRSGSPAQADPGGIPGSAGARGEPRSGFLHRAVSRARGGDPRPVRGRSVADPPGELEHGGLVANGAVAPGEYRSLRSRGFPHPIRPHFDSDPVYDPLRLRCTAPGDRFRAGAAARRRGNGRGLPGPPEKPSQAGRGQADVPRGPGLAQPGPAVHRRGSRPGPAPAPEHRRRARDRPDARRPPLPRHGPDRGWRNARRADQGRSGSCRPGRSAGGNDRRGHRPRPQPGRGPSGPEALQRAGGCRR